MAATFEIYEDQSGTWRWKLFAGNKTQIAASGDPHPTRSSAESAVKAVKRDAANATDSRHTGEAGKKIRSQQHLGASQ